MHRFYALDVQPDLFGQWCLIREWGRIGKPSQVRHIPFATEGEALTALARQRQAKERRGYATNRQEQSAPATRATLAAGEPGASKNRRRILSGFHKAVHTRAQSHPLF
jgi:predicted DNA-binding WGR domain protein